MNAVSAKFHRSLSIPPASLNKDNSTATILCFAAAFVTGTAAFILDLTVEGRWAFMSAMLMAISIDGILWFAIMKDDHRCFSLKLAFVGFMIIKVFPVGACLTLGLSQDYLFPGGNYLMESPFKAALAGDIRNMSIALVFIMTRLVSQKQRYDIPIRRMFNFTSPRIEAFMIFAAVINLLYWVAVTSLDNPIFYFIRILEKTFTIVPFFVGLTALRFKKALSFWLVVLILQLGISFLTGTRGASFIPIGYFLIGFTMGLPNWRSRFKWGITVLFPILVLLFAAGVYIGGARSVTGRTDLKTALTQGTMLQAMEESHVASLVTYRGNFAFEAFRRLSLWPDYIVPAMTPDPIPYRGFSDFFYEVRSAFGLGIFSLINPNWRGNYYFGNLFLQQYGFAVHVDAAGMKTSNVELPVQVDAFMRGGWIPAFGFSIFLASLVFTVERFLRSRLLPHKQPFFLMFLMVLCFISYPRFMAMSLVDATRSLVLEGGFGFVVLYSFDFLLSYFAKRPTTFKLR